MQRQIAHAGPLRRKRKLLQHGESVRQHLRAGEVGEPKAEIKWVGHNRLNSGSFALTARFDSIWMRNGARKMRRDEKILCATKLLAWIRDRPSAYFDRVGKGCYDQLSPKIKSPHRSPRRLAWPRTSPFHGGNTGSNPVGDANLINNLWNCRFRRATGDSRPPPAQRSHRRVLQSLMKAERHEVS